MTISKIRCVSQALKPGRLAVPRRTLALSLLLVPAVISAQTASSNPPADSSVIVAPDVISLNPFEVVSERDDGFSATNAGTATKLGLDMKDVAAPYSVMTGEFIKAMGITDLQEAILWSTNGAPVFDGQGADLYNIPSLANVRGIVLHTGQQRDFFVTASVGDTYNIERIDFGRGPNAVLFNVGANDALGGGMSMTGKRARSDRNSEELSLKVGSWDYYRATFDYNHVISDRFAIRANVLAQKRGGYLDGEFEDKSGITLAGTYRVAPKTELRFEASYDKLERSRPPISQFDNLSGWDGQTTFATQISNAQYSGNATVGPVYGLTYSGSPQGVFREGSNRYIYDPASGTVMNWIYTGSTRRGDENERVPIYIGGVQWVRNSTLLLPLGNGGGSGGNNRTPSLTANGGQAPFTYAINLPDDRFSNVLANSNFTIPGKTKTIVPDAPLFSQTVKNLSLAFTHQFSDTLFLDVSANYNDTYNTPINSHLGLRTAYLDINENLPDGTANPNFLEPYSQMEPRYYNRDTENMGVRAVLGYIKDLGKWGNYTFNLSLGATARNTTHRQYWNSLALATDPREWQAERLTTRYYWNDNVRPFWDLAPTSLYNVVPVSGGNSGYTTSTSTIQPRWVLNDWWDQEESSTSAIIAFAGKYFDDKLVVSPGIRVDSQETYKRSRPTSYGFLPVDANWDGVTLSDVYYRPDAPSDWLTLSYIPRNNDGTARSTVAIPASGNRPTLGGVNGVSPGNPVYANDRFRNDYNAPRYKKTVLNKTAGLVYHAFPWASLMLNFADSYRPSDVGRFVLDGNQADPETGISYEAGIAFNMFDGRLSLTPRYFFNRAENILGTPPTTGSINALMGRKSWNDASAQGYNSLGYGEVLGQDYYARKNDGLELEIVGRISKHWRVTGSFGTGQRTDYDRWQNTRKYVEDRADDFLQVLQAAGGKLDTAQIPQNAGHAIVGAPGLAIADPAITNQMITDAGGNTGVRTNAVNDYNNIWVQYDNIAYLAETVGLKRITAKLFTDFSFNEGKLKGLRMGVGVNWIDNDIAGYRSADTIVNPSYNPSLPVSSSNLPYMDDPDVDLNTPIYSKRPLEMTVTLGYSRKLKSNRWFANAKEIDFNLVIRNALNSQAIFYQDDGVVARPPDGDYTSPVRVSVPGRIASFQRPINFELTTTLKF